MASTTEGEKKVLDKLLQVMKRGGSNTRVNIGNNTYDGLGTFGNDANCIGTRDFPFERVSSVIVLTNDYELITVPSDTPCTVDRVYVADGTSVDGLTDKIVFESLGLSTANDTHYTVGGNFKINTFSVTISEV